MEHDNDLQPQKIPFYKRPRVYLISVLSAAAGLFLLIILTVFALRWVNPSATSFTYQENWDEMEMERYSLTKYWIPADEIPEHMKWAVIASEDQLFYEHSGFDLESIREAWDERQQGERVRGASTISQQVAKNLFLSPAQSFLRKGIEAGFTVLIELFWPKERIMEVYLNIAEFGPGIFGIGKASETFFEISAASITPEMSARFAAVLPSPKRMRVNPPSPYAEERSKWILRQMTQLSGIAYHRPVIKNEPDTELESISPLNNVSTNKSDDNLDYHFNKLDSLITSFDSNPSSLPDSDDILNIGDTLNVQMPDTSVSN